MKHALTLCGQKVLNKLGVKLAGAKAGVGKESYAIINQGMADSILLSSPIERRIVIEDAAGVKQYQIKKERSLRKLESTRENLSRVRGIVEEIRPHIRTLKRQADKAAPLPQMLDRLTDALRDPPMSEWDRVRFGGDDD